VRGRQRPAHDGGGKRPSFNGRAGGGRRRIGLGMTPGVPAGPRWSTQMQNLPDKARSSPRRRPQAARSGRRLYPSARPGPASAGRRARGDLPPAQGPTAGHRPRRAATTACPGKGSQPGAERTGQAVPPVLPGAVRAGARTSPVRTSPDPTGAATGGPQTDSRWHPHRWPRHGAGRAWQEAGRTDRPKAPAAGPSARRSGSAPPNCSPKMPTSSVADRLGVARQTAVSWRARWRETGAAALRSRGPSRRPAVPDSQLPAIEKACSRALAPTASTVTCGPRPGSRRSSSRYRVQLGAHAVQRLLHGRLGWSVQPMTGRQRGSQSVDGTAATGTPAGQGTGQGR
jgi:transposase